MSLSLQTHLLLAAGWIFWCVLHSLLISRWWITRMQRVLGERMAYYRFVYVVVSVVTIVPVLWLQWTIDSSLLWRWELPWSVFQWLGIAVSALLFYLGAQQYDQKFFFGVRQIQDHRGKRTSEFSGFSASGIHTVIRHPYYAAGIVLLVFWGNLTPASLVMKSVGILYFIAGALLEERKLLAEFGREYRSYQQAVPMFIPRSLRSLITGTGRRGKE
jgi:protein-S-isoprenylcysteine O-methyltransferase Ste14